MAWNPEVSISDLLSAPVVNRDWRVKTTDPTLVRFGLIWEVYDLVEKLGLDPRVPILGPGNMP